MDATGKEDLPSTNRQTLNEHRAYVPKVNRMKGVPPHLLMVPYPAQPHIVPMLSLARQLASHGGMKITYVCHQKLIDRLLRDDSNWNDAIRFVGVPDKLPGFEIPSEFPANPIVFTESLELGYCMGPFVDQLLQDQDSLQGPTCMITDWMNWWSMVADLRNFKRLLEDEKLPLTPFTAFGRHFSEDIAAKLGIPRYALCVCPAAALQLMFQCPAEGYVFDGNDSFKQVRGLPPLQNHHIMRCLLNDDEYRNVFLTKWPKCVLESDGVLVDTCLALEFEVIDALRDTLPRDMPVLTVGPLGLSPHLASKAVSLEGLPISDETLIINWLSEQPPLSVLYVSFGTTGLFNLSKRHVTELARGLEASGQRFLWVFRAPPGVDEDDPDLLPLGFEGRVKGRGLLLRGWAPQLQILAHPSTGAFLSSCGWNSAIESLALGVPVIGWPSFADQPVVSRHLEVTLKAGISLPYNKDHFVEAKDFVKAINLLQSEEGSVMRQRTEKYKTSIVAAIAPDGSSYEAVIEFINLVKGELVST